MSSDHKSISLTTEDEYTIIRKGKNTTFLREYITSSGMIVYKDNISSTFYIYYKSDYFKASNVEAFNMFVKSPDLYAGRLSKGVDTTVREVLFGKNVYGESFPNNADRLCKDLLSELEIRTNSGRSDTILLDQIEKKLKKNGSRKKYINKNFISFLALMGELLIRHNPEIRWEMSLSDDKTTWNPDLSYKDQIIGLIAYLYEGLIEEDRSLSQVYELINIIIRVNLS